MGKSSSKPVQEEVRHHYPYTSHHLKNAILRSHEYIQHRPWIFDLEENIWNHPINDFQDVDAVFSELST